MSIIKAYVLQAIIYIDITNEFRITTPTCISLECMSYYQVVLHATCDFSFFGKLKQ